MSPCFVQTNSTEWCETMIQQWLKKSKKIEENTIERNRQTERQMPENAVYLRPVVAQDRCHALTLSM